MVTDNGKFTIKDEVFSFIVNKVVTEVKDVADMSGKLTDEFKKALRLGQSSSKGIKIESGEEEVAIDINILVNYGGYIPRIVKEVQDTVKEMVETMTGYRVVEVNVNVEGLVLPEKTKVLESPEESSSRVQ